MVRGRRLEAPAVRPDALQNGVRLIINTSTVIDSGGRYSCLSVPVTLSADKRQENLSQHLRTETSIGPDRSSRLQSQQHLETFRLGIQQRTTCDRSFAANKHLVSPGSRKFCNALTLLDRANARLICQTTCRHLRPETDLVAVTEGLPCRRIDERTSENTPGGASLPTM